MIVVQLRIFKGSEITKGEQGQIKNQNQTLKLKYDTKEWHNFIGTMYRNGWGRVNVLSAKIDKSGEVDWEKYEDVDSGVIEKIKAEVQSKLVKTSNKPLTQDQKEIAELKAQVAQLVEASKDKTPNVNEELESARKELKDLTGKTPSHLFKLETLQTKIAEAKAAQ